MKRLLILIAALCPVLCAGQNPRQAYIEKYSALAVSEMQRTGVPASITLAQGIVESGAGQSPLAVHANNHFGIKCHNDWTGKKYYKDDEQVQECFRAYASVEESYRAHSDFLRARDRYKGLFDLDPTDYKGWARGLKRAGYATDPAYATKLIDLIEDFGLDRFDRDVAVEVAPPKELETPRQVAPEALRDTRYRESVTLSLVRPVFEQNGVRFVRAIEGETYSSIAEDFGLFTREILRFNDVDKDVLLDPGTVVYIARKKAEAPYGIGKYVIDREGETLWEISQRFAIQLGKLRLYNAYLGGKPLEPGDTVLLRKL
ncbi:MAG: glucosaminidase domain-containing protein [Bacteroidales bacterium]|nr:glucosaminidase domain-containing protein [Bacteroidales bacterium]